MRKKWVVLTIAATLMVYTVGIVLGFYFTQRAGGAGESANNGSVQSYTHVILTDEEKADVYEGIGLDISKLAERGFAAYSEVFMTPTDWKKELHVVQLAFENIYCRATVYIHPDEIGWERTQGSRTGVTYTPTEVVGLQFERRETTLHFDDAEHGRFYAFYCSEEPDGALYQEFLRLFFNREAA